MTPNHLIRWWYRPKDPTRPPEVGAIWLPADVAEQMRDRIGDGPTDYQLKDWEYDLITELAACSSWSFHDFACARAALAADLDEAEIRRALRILAATPPPPGTEDDPDDEAAGP